MPLNDMSCNVTTITFMLYDTLFSIHLVTVILLLSLDGIHLNA